MDFDRCLEVLKGAKRFLRNQYLLMVPTDMKTRWIIVPKDKKAETLLDYDEAKDEDLLIIKLDDAGFYHLFRSGFFNAINDAAGVIIDDYEYEIISNPTALNKAIEAIVSYSSGIHESSPAVNDILNLFREAIERGTSVSFFF